MTSLGDELLRLLNRQDIPTVPPAPSRQVEPANTAAGAEHRQEFLLRYLGTSKTGLARQLGIHPSTLRRAVRQTSRPPGTAGQQALRRHYSEATATSRGRKLRAEMNDEKRHTHQQAKERRAKARLAVLKTLRSIIIAGDPLIVRFSAQVTERDKFLAEDLRLTGLLVPWTRNDSDAIDEAFHSALNAAYDGGVELSGNVTGITITDTWPS